MDNTNKIIVGISVGDINGIGIEIILKTFEDKRMLEFCTPVLFASSRLVSYHKKNLKLNNNIHGITSIDKISHDKINLMNSWTEEVKIEIGKITEIGGKFAYKSLEAATNALKNNKIDVLLTAPISKENIQSEAFNFPGHTEYLEENLDGKSLMILMADKLRIGLITGHIPISKVAETITPELIKEKVEVMHASLKQDFGINKPKIAILGLNPHCGDNGIIGKEDDEITRPTINEIKETGKLIFGPYAADGFFGSETYKQFDGVLAMYHDQGLPVLKYKGFGSSVNITLGLPFIRTSVDHGTALELAGTTKADSGSFLEAIKNAINLASNT